MRMKLPKLLDCTLRDGGYINNWSFSKHFGEALYRAVSNAGCDYIEVGFMEPNANDFGSPWTNLSNEYLAELRQKVVQGTKIAVMINYGSVDLEDVPNAADYNADMIRVAASQENAQPASAFAAALTAKGYETTVNYMGISNYSNEEILSLVDLMNQYKRDVNYFYVADSFGSLMPKRTREIFTTLRFGTDACLGFHPHNNLQLAFANCLEAMEAGVDIIDGSVYGMGRGAGNLFTEAMLAYYEQQEPEQYRLLPVLQFADLYMEELKKSFDWGYTLPQLLSGVMRCHPNYPTKLLREKAYTADDIYRMLQHLPEDNKQRFTSDSLNFLKQQHMLVTSEEKDVNVSPSMADLCRKSQQSALLICGGRSVVEQKNLIEEFISNHSLAVFSVNNPSPPIATNGVFFGNRRRLLKNFDQIVHEGEVIFGPGIHEAADTDFCFPNISRVNPLKLLPNDDLPFSSLLPSNSAVLGILGLIQCGFSKIFVCGLDGYGQGDNYYYKELDQIAGESDRARENALIQSELDTLDGLRSRLGFSVEIITYSLFSLGRSYE